MYKYVFYYDDMMIIMGRHASIFAVVCIFSTKYPNHMKIGYITFAALVSTKFKSFIKTQ